MGPSRYRSVTVSLTVVESYQISGYHTYISAAITALIFLCMFAGMVVLYKNLAPRSRSLVSSRKHESTNGIEESADTKTQDLWDVENEDLGKLSLLDLHVPVFAVQLFQNLADWVYSLVTNFWWRVNWQ